MTDEVEEVLTGVANRFGSDVLVVLHRDLDGKVALSLSQGGMNRHLDVAKSDIILLDGHKWLVEEVYPRILTTARQGPGQAERALRLRLTHPHQG